MITLNTKDLGFGIFSASVVFRNLAADDLRLSRVYDGASPFAYGDNIELVDDELGRLFVGRVDTVQTSWQGGAYTQNITVLNDVGWLGRITYIEDRFTNSGFTCWLGSTLLRESHTTPLIKLDEVLPVPFDFAQGQVNLSLDAKTGASGPDYQPSGQDSVLDCMTALASWLPSPRAWVDYRSEVPRWLWQRSTAQRTLVFDIISQDFDDATVGACKGFSALNIEPRHDLRPPAVVLSGGVNYLLGGAKNARDAYVFHVPASAMNGSASGAAPYAGVGPSAQAANKQRQDIRGVKLTQDIVTYDEPERNIFTIPLTNANLTRFWQQFELGKTLLKYKDKIKATKFYANIMAAEDAYPADEETGLSTVPANYQIPSENPANWLNTCVFIEGSFPASVERAQCLSGLSYCKAELKQYLRLTDFIDPKQNVDDLLEIFNSVVRVKLDSGGYANAPVAEITFPVILINRSRKQYYPIDLTLAEGDPEYTGYESPEVPYVYNELYANEWKKYADEFWAESRILQHDGNLTLQGAQIHPAELLSSAIALQGLGQVVTGSVQEVSLDLFTQEMGIKFGATEIQGIDERYNRNQATNAYIERATESQQNPAAEQAGDGSLSEDEFEALSPETIQPQMQANAAPVVASTKVRPPFTVYREGGRVWFKGGTKSLLTGDVVIEDTDITDVYANNQVWRLDVEVNPETRKYEAVIRYTQKP